MFFFWLPQALPGYCYDDVIYTERKLSRQISLSVQGICIVLQGLVFIIAGICVI